jgi:hypothetical protein
MRYFAGAARTVPPDVGRQHMARRWNRFFCHLQKDLKMWLFFLLVLALNRVVFIVVFRHEIQGDRIAHDILAALAFGLRFDVMASSYWMLVPLGMSLMCSVRDWDAKADRLRAVWGGVFLVTTIMLSIVSVEYYREYHDVFNQLLFKVGEDDMTAILSTLYADYHPISYLLLAVALIAAGLGICRRYFAGEFVPEAVFRKYTTSHWRRDIINLTMAGLVFVGIRGSFAYRPVQVKDAGITSDRFLNKAVLNPHIALVDAVRLHCTRIGDSGLEEYLPDNDIATALKQVFPNVSRAIAIDPCLERISAGPRVAPPRHVFLLQLESYDAWPMLDKYAGLRLTENGRRLAREGLHLTAFLPSGGQTIESYSTLITGLPYTMLQVRLEIAGRGVLPTSLPETLRRLGYRTRFFYSGYLSWQNVGDFSTSQGFDEVYGAKHAVPTAIANEWGVADQFLYDLVAKTVSDDRPSFNFVMTTTYHPPYNFDLKALGVALPTVPPELEKQFDCNRPQMLNILGHLRYADQALGRFVDQVEAKLPKTLFAITGDHYSRRFINAKPTLFESSAVPLILYGKDVLRGVRLPETAVGSHIDVAATLIEAVAPQGFKYYAIGHNLLDPQACSLGYNSERIIGPDFLLEIDKTSNLEIGKARTFARVPGRPLPAILPDLEALIRQVHTVQGIAWWRIRKGSELPPETLLGRATGAQRLR